MRPPCVCLLSALAAPPNLVRHVSSKCPPCVCFGRASKRCPPCVPLMSALASPQNLGLRPCVRLALYPPCVGFGRVSKCCISHVALCVCHVSAPCLFFVFWLSARCSLFIRSLLVFGQVYGLALAGPLSALCPLFGFCAFICYVSRSLWLRLCPLFVWSLLAGSALVCLKAWPRIYTLSVVFPFCPFFCLCVCPGFVWVCLCPDLYTKLGHAFFWCSAGPRLNRLSQTAWGLCRCTYIYS